MYYLVDIKGGLQSIQSIFNALWNPSLRLEKNIECLMFTKISVINVAIKPFVFILIYIMEISSPIIYPEV